jgi:predicted metallopeptidase
MKPGTPFDFCAAMRELCRDLCARLPDEYGHIDMDQVAVAFAQVRRRVTHGLQAKLTPMRFAGGALVERRFGRTWTVRRLFDDGHEVLYILTFYLPRFLEHPPLEKLVTVLHELYHISPLFDGDIRRFDGRYHVHSHSQKDYDRLMEEHAKRYLAAEPPRHLCGFLDKTFRELERDHGRVYGVKVPIPKLIPIVESRPVNSDPYLSECASRKPRRSRRRPRRPRRES